MTASQQALDPGPLAGHVHPTPAWLRAAFVSFGLGMALVLVMGGYLYHQNSVTVRQQAVQLDQRTKALADELNAQRVARNAETAKQQALTNDAICTVLRADLPPSASVRALAQRLSCVLPTTR